MPEYHPPFSTVEGRVLITLYEYPEANWSTHLLTQQLNQNVVLAHPDFAAEFDKTRDAIEELILHSLVKGKRLSGAQGVYFGDLRLTYKGEQAAIQVRRERARAAKELPRVDPAATEIKDHQEE